MDAGEAFALKNIRSAIAPLFSNRDVASCDMPNVLMTISGVLWSCAFMVLDSLCRLIIFKELILNTV